MTAGATITEVDCVSKRIPPHDVVVVREGAAKIVGTKPVTGRLYARPAARSAASVLTLLRGSAGAAPHHHTGSSELFSVISDEHILTARGGDLVVVPPGTVHAFAAATASDAGMLSSQPIGLKSSRDTPLHASRHPGRTATLAGSESQRRADPDVHPQRDGCGFPNLMSGWVTRSRLGSALSPKAETSAACRAGLA
jgi:mannose-6-phosphate isomerase-like protein (cupin superfamily)